VTVCYVTNLTVLYYFLCLLAFVSFSLVYVQRTFFPLWSPFHSFLFEKRCSRLSQSLLYCLLCLLVPLSSLFLLYVQRKVIGACQNRYSIVFCVCWFRSRLLFSFMFKGRLLAPVKIVCWFCSLLLFTPFCLKNVLVGCLNLCSIVFLLYLLVPLSSPFLLYVQRTFLAPVKIVCWFLSGLLITPFCLKNVLGGCLNLYSIILSSISSPFLSFIVNGMFFAAVSIC
jgi:hypothetical protein